MSARIRAAELDAAELAKTMGMAGYAGSLGGEIQLQVPSLQSAPQNWNLDGEVILFDGSLPFDRL